MKLVRFSQGDQKISQIPIAQPAGLSLRLRCDRIGVLTQVRATPESVKRRLRPILVWLVRATLAIPGSRRVALSVMRRMPETSSWLLRHYQTYRQMSLGKNAPRGRPAVAGADDLSPDEVLHLRWIEAALQARQRR